MNKIKQLPLHEAQKIAAGEVVERPANVVKELIENSIDAGAKKITIYVQQAGQTSIQIIDDGCGMSPEDAVLCFDHHATSKITSVQDLLILSTFGFRGEALASISAVSNVTLTTKEHDATQGLKIERRQGSTIARNEVACNHGTDILIKDLFFNVPARKKFLKTEQTEWRQIAQLFHAFCFDYTTIHFQLFSDGKQIYNAPPVNSLQERITQVWDSNTANNMLMVKNTDGIKLNGIISNYQYYRYDRTYIYFFVNKRWVKNQSLAKALLKGYLNVIPHGRFPAAIVCLEVDPQEVDINIHPRKQEVQFLHPRRIEQAITTAVKKCLEENLSKKINRPVEFNNNSPQHFPTMQQPVYTHPVKTAIFDTQPNSIVFPKPTLEKLSEIEPTKKNAPAKKEQSEVDIFVQEPSFQLLSQLKKTYILAQSPEGLFIVDQHAAHERILYEQFRTRFGSIATVQLLFPHVITLVQDEYNVILSHTELLQNHGIIFESFGRDQIIIQSIPVHLKNSPLDELIKEIISLIKEHRHLPQEEFIKILHEQIHAQMACKAAVKAGDDLTKEQMQKLLDDLDITENRFACPHGRPTGWLISTDELEKKFKRKK